MMRPDSSPTFCSQITHSTTPLLPDMQYTPGNEGRLCPSVLALEFDTASRSYRYRHESSQSWKCFRRQAPMGVVTDGPPWNQHRFWQRVLGTCYCEINIEPAAAPKQHAIRESMKATMPMIRRCRGGASVPPTNKAWR
jgi:hypothetical protein